jgi:hypothetical protein
MAFFWSVYAPAYDRFARGYERLVIYQSPQVRLGGLHMRTTSDSEKIGGALAKDGDRAGVTALDLRYRLEDKPTPVASLLFGLQHVLIMFTAMIVSPLVIGQLLNLPAETRATMITGVMIGCGAGTMISALGVGWVGSRLPLLLGAYTVYIGPVVAIFESGRCNFGHADRCRLLARG